MKQTLLTILVLLTNSIYVWSQIIEVPEDTTQAASQPGLYSDAYRDGGRYLRGNTGSTQLTSTRIFRNLAELRNFTSPSEGLQYYLSERGKEGYWYWDSTDNTSADNVGTIVVTSNGKRMKRAVTPWILPEWFGAKGDEITDDYPALQAAINALMKTGGGELRLTQRVYLISQPLLITSLLKRTDTYKPIHFYTNGRFLLNSPGKSILRASQPMKAMLMITWIGNVGDGSPYYSEINSVYLDGNKLADKAIVTDWAIHVKIEKCIIHQCKVGVQNAATSTSGSYGVTTIEKCVIHADTCIAIYQGDSKILYNDLYPDKVGTYMPPWSGNSIIAGNIFNNEEGSKPGEKCGIFFNGTISVDGSREIRHVYVHDNEFYALHHAIQIKGSTSQKNVYQLSIYANHVRGAGWNWNCNFVKAEKARDIDLRGNFFSLGDDPAISLKGFFLNAKDCERIKITENTAINTAETVIQLDHSYNCLIANNMLTDVSKIDSVVKASILLVNQSTYNKIYNNTIQTKAGYTDLFLEELSNSDYNQAYDNSGIDVKVMYLKVGAHSSFIQNIYSTFPPTQGYYLPGTTVTNPDATSGQVYMWKADGGCPGNWKIVSKVD